MPAYHYNPPPNWPPPPPGWAPGPGWQPDPAWGPPPQGWQLWVEQPEARPPRSRAALAGGAALVTLIAVLAVVTLVALVSPDQEPVVTTPAVGAPGRPPPTPTATPSSTPTPTPAPTPDVPPGVPAGAQVARVVDVPDGDTLTIAAAATGAVLSTTDPVRVRLLQIDTPEQGEPLSDEATAGLVALAGPGTTVWALRDQDPRDQYGRELLYLWTGDGTFVNEEMVLSGLATAVLYEPQRPLHRPDACRPGSGPIGRHRALGAASSSTTSTTAGTSSRPGNRTRDRPTTTRAGAPGWRPLRPLLPRCLHPAPPAGPRLRRDRVQPFRGPAARPARLRPRQGRRRLRERLKTWPQASRSPRRASCPRPAPDAAADARRDCLLTGAVTP
jgi:micrococcal nuclease